MFGHYFYSVINLDCFYDLIESFIFTKRDFLSLDSVDDWEHGDLIDIGLESGMIIFGCDIRLG